VEVFVVKLQMLLFENEGQAPHARFFKNYQGTGNIRPLSPANERTLDLSNVSLPALSAYHPKLL
jgi:hypothetical protein